MKVRTFAAGFAMAAFALPCLAVNKCTAPDGTVTFQDAVCPAAARAQEAVKVHRQGTISAAGTLGLAPLDFTGPPTQRFVRAAALETLADMSTDCKIKLQVYGSSSEALDLCKRFTSYHGVWWTPATDALAELMKDNAWAAANVLLVERTTRHMGTVNRNAEFILLKLKSMR